MRDQDTLEALGSIARDELAAREPRWEAFSAGQIAEEELRRQLAGSLSDDELERGVALFRPLDEDARAALGERLLAAGREPAAVVPLRPRRRALRLLAAAGTLAAAAALALWIGRAPGDPEAGAGPGSAPLILPGYHLEVHGGLAPVRAPAPGQLPGNAYAPETEIEVVLRPARDVASEVTARLFAFSGDEGRELAGALQVADSGAVLLKGPAREVLPLSPGRWRLVFVVGQADALPRSPAEARDLPAHRAGPTGSYWVEEYSVELRGEGR